MKKAEQLSVVGILLSMSVAFWGKDMADYVEKELPLPPADAFVSTNNRAFVELGEWAEAETNKPAIQEWSRLVNLPSTSSPTNLHGVLAWRTAFAAVNSHLSAEGVTSNLTFKAVNAKSKTKITAPSHNRAKDFMNAARMSLLNRLVSWLGVLFAGCVFMVDVACIYWWYFRYIYKIQTTPTLPGMFFDIAVCASFNLAAARWTSPPVFLMASGVGSSLLIARFVNLYRSPEASLSDQTILKRAGWQIGVLVLCLILVYLLLRQNVKQPWETLLYAGLVSGLAGIGIALTVLSRDRIRLSIEQQAIPEKRFIPMEVLWPEPLRKASLIREQIRENTRKGIYAFRKLFVENNRRYTRMVSRVHAEGDLFTQSYILAVPSFHPAAETSRWGRGRLAVAEVPRLEEDEVERKAWMVAASHWLDDLVDGREELRIYARIRKAHACIFSHDEDTALQGFELIFHKVVVQHTDKEFYDCLVKDIRNQTTVPLNCAYLFSGLNRVGVGSLLFSPKIGPEERRALLQAHNKALVQRITESGPPPGTSDVDGRRWLEDVKEFLNKLERGPDEMGDVLLGLTTKTVVEISMASEGPNVYFPLAVLYSLLYAPLLYFHDIDPEIESEEMGVLETFDVNFEALSGWLPRIRKLIERVPDERKESRLLQAQMAYNCFKEFIPKFMREEFQEVYIPSQESKEPIEPAEFP